MSKDKTALVVPRDVLLGLIAEVVEYHFRLCEPPNPGGERVRETRYEAVRKALKRVSPYVPGGCCVPRKFSEVKPK